MQKTLQLWCTIFETATPLLTVFQTQKLKGRLLLSEKVLLTENYQAITSMTFGNQEPDT